MRRPIFIILIVALSLVFAASMAPKAKVVQAQQPAAATEVTHVVQPGENLFRISLRYGVTVQSVASANGIANPNIIYVGQSLKIPGGTNTGSTGGQPGGGSTGGNTGGTSTYTVVAGDTLSKIARQFNTTIQAIAQANNIANVNLIFVGQSLNIPGTSTGGNTGGTATPTGSSTPTPGSTVDMNPFELGGHVLNFSNITQMQSASMKWAKVQIRYTAGTNPDVTAPAINEAHLNGFKILLGIVGDKNEMASKGFDAYNTEFATFVEGVARLGPEGIEIWNEPNLDREWPSGQISATTYTALLRKSYEAIKRINPAIMVISGAPAPTGFFNGCTAAGCDDAPFVRGMAAAGAANYMDCIGIHYNEGIISPTARSGDPRGNGGHYTRYYYGMLDTYSQAFGNAKKLCFTELGYATPEGFTQSAPAGFEWIANTSLQEQTLWLGEAAQLSRSSGRVRMMIVWNVNFKDASPDPSGMYAIVRPDGSCPACATLAQAMK